MKTTFPSFLLPFCVGLALQPGASAQTLPSYVQSSLSHSVDVHHGYGSKPLRTYGADTTLSFNLAQRTLLTIVNGSQWGHDLYVVGPGGSIQAEMLSPWIGANSTQVDVVLETGNSSIWIEQASATQEDVYSYAFKTICVPVLAAGANYLAGYWLNGFYPTQANQGGFVNQYYEDNVGNFGYLKIGERNYLRVQPSAAPMYHRLFADLNLDGDFADAGEQLTSTAGAVGDSILAFSLSTSNPVYTNANGTGVRMRLLSTLTNATGGACGTYGEGSAVDFGAKVWVSPAYAPGGDFAWARPMIASGLTLTRVRTAPDGSLYSCGSYMSDYSPINDGTPYGMYRKIASVSVNGFPGKHNQSYSRTDIGYKFDYMGQMGLLTKHTRDGSLAWAVTMRTYGYPAWSTCDIKAEAVDKFGYVYIAGLVKTGSGCIITSSLGWSQSVPGFSAFVAKFHPNGQLVYWLPIGDGNTTITGLDVAPDLRVYVAGQFRDPIQIKGSSGMAVNLTSRGNYDTFLAKFSDVGTLYWVIQGGGTGNDYAYGAAADKNGGGYLMGSFEGTATFNFSTTQAGAITKTSSGGSDGFVMGVSQTGNINWVTALGGPVNENVSDLAADPRGTGLVAVGGFGGTVNFGGTSLTSAGYYDAFAARISNNGAVQWATKAGGFGQEQAAAVRLDHNGNPWVLMSYSDNVPSAFGGRPLARVSGADGALMRLDGATGQLTATAPLSQFGSFNGIGSLDTVDNGGAAMVGYAGTQTSLGRLGQTFVGNGACYLARFSAYQAGFLREEHTPTAASPAGRLTVYPNPATGPAILTLQGQTGPLQVELFDASGRLHTSITAQGEQLQTGLPLPTDLPNGLYLLRAGSETTRFVMAR